MDESRWRDEGAVSEVVGALLLVVVVSTAAFGFGVFLNQQRERAAEQKAFEQERSLERLVVLGVRPDDAGLDGDWDSFEVDLASLHLKGSRIVNVRVNGVPASWGPIGQDFNGTDDVNLTAGQDVFVPPRAQGTLSIEAADLAGAPAFATTSPLEVEVVSERGNRFRTAFVPPLALFGMEQEGTSPNIVYSFSASRSEPGSGDAFLVSFAWTVYATPATCENAVATGGGEGFQFNAGATQSYCVELRVTDSNGLVGVRRLVLALSD